MSPQDAITLALNLGATAADAALVEDDSFSVQVRLGKVETVKSAREQRLFLRVFMGQSVASVSTSDLTHDALERLVQEACTLAGSTAPDPYAGLPHPDQIAGEIPHLDLWDPEGHTVSVEEKIDRARKAEAAALAIDPRISNSEGAEWGDVEARVAYASSHGFAGEFRASAFSLSVAPVASQDGGMQRDSWSTAARKLWRLDPPEVVGQTAARRVLRRLGARKVHTQEVPVVFDPETAAGLIASVGSAAFGYALYRRASFLVEKLGERIGSGNLTLIDDGTIPQGLGSRPFDSEGLPTRKTTVVEGGILKSFLLDTYSARKLGRASTGNASRDGAGGIGVSATNLYLAPGPHTPEEILASVRQGLYVTELIGFGVNLVTGDYSRGAVGLWIENGELAFPVEEVTIAGNLLKMYADLEMVGNDMDWRRRIVAPTLKIARMTVAGH